MSSNGIGSAIRNWRVNSAWGERSQSDRLLAQEFTNETGKFCSNFNGFDLMGRPVDQDIYQDKQLGCVNIERILNRENDLRPKYFQLITLNNAGMNGGRGNEKGFPTFGSTSPSTSLKPDFADSAEFGPEVLAQGAALSPNSRKLYAGGNIYRPDELSDGDSRSFISAESSEQTTQSDGSAATFSSGRTNPFLRGANNRLHGTNKRNASPFQSTFHENATTLSSPFQYQGVYGGASYNFDEDYLPADGTLPYNAWNYQDPHGNSKCSTNGEDFPTDLFNTSKPIYPVTTTPSVRNFEKNIPALSSKYRTISGEA